MAQQQDDHDTAAALARRLIEVDHYDESAHELLVQSLLAAGDPAAAWHAHQLWARYLSEIDITVQPFEH